MSQEVVKIKPNHYIHILDTNTGISRLEVGSKTLTLKDHEELELRETPMPIIPPRHYAIILNPVVKDNSGKIVLDKDGQVKVRHGDKEIRFEQDPFPLYPGEDTEDDKDGDEIIELEMVPPNKALRLQALRSFDEIIPSNNEEDLDEE